MRFSTILVSTVLLTLTHPMAAAPGGLGIEILIDCSRTVLTPAAATALDGCLDDDGTALLIHDDAGLGCAEPTAGSALECARSGGFCIVENISGRQLAACDAGSDEQLFELTLSTVRSAGPLELEWPIGDSLRCASATGVCKNPRSTEDSARLAEAVETCADLDGDGFSDLFTTGDRVRCSAEARDGQPLVEIARVVIAAPCDASGLDADLEAMLAALVVDGTTSFLETLDGRAGVEIRWPEP